MNSSNYPSSFSHESYVGSLLLYSVIAVIFFFIGRNYDQIRSNLRQQAQEKRSSKVTLLIFLNWYNVRIVLRVPKD